MQPSPNQPLCQTRVTRLWLQIYGYPAAGETVQGTEGEILTELPRAWSRSPSLLPHRTGRSAKGWAFQEGPEGLGQIQDTELERKDDKKKSRELPADQGRNARRPSRLREEAVLVPRREHSDFSAFPRLAPNLTPSTNTPRRFAGKRSGCRVSTSTEPRRALPGPLKNPAVGTTHVFEYRWQGTERLSLRF